MLYKFELQHGTPDAAEEVRLLKSSLYWQLVLEICLLICKQSLAYPNKFCLPESDCCCSRPSLNYSKCPICMSA